MSRGFDRFMVSNAIGTNRKLRRLPVAQRWVYVAGVLSLASQSPIRGALLITDNEAVTAEDLAEEATVKVADAKAALKALRELGMLDTDDKGVDWVHDWDAMNPAPRPSDSPDAARARKRDQRDREKATRRADVTPMSRVTGGDGHAAKRAVSRGEVEGEGEGKAPLPPAGGSVDLAVTSEEAAPSRPATGRKRDIDKFEAQMNEWAARHFPDAKPGAVKGVIGSVAGRSPDAAVTAADVADWARREGEAWADALGLPALDESAAA